MLPPPPPPTCPQCGAPLSFAVSRKCHRIPVCPNCGYLVAEKKKSSPHQHGDEDCGHCLGVLIGVFVIILIVIGLIACAALGIAVHLLNK